MEFVRVCMLYTCMPCNNQNPIYGYQTLPFLKSDTPYTHSTNPLLVYYRLKHYIPRNVGMKTYYFDMYIGSVLLFRLYTQCVCVCVCVCVEHLLMLLVEA